MRDGLPLPGYVCSKVEFGCRQGREHVEGSGKRRRVVGCRYWVRCGRLGNCVLRVDRAHEEQEIAVIEGVTRQAINKLEHSAVKKIREGMRMYRGEVVDVLRDMYAVSSRSDTWE